MKRIMQSELFMNSCSCVPYWSDVIIVQGFLYWTDWQTESLMRSDLSGHNLITLVGNLQSLMDVKVFHEPTPLAGEDRE